MKGFILDIMLVATISTNFIPICDGNMQPIWTYPGLWYYSTLPRLYHSPRQVPILPHTTPNVPFIQPPLHRSISTATNLYSTMVHDTCESRNWGNLVGKCRMSCNLYDGTCTETLITTDCGCNGKLVVQ